ncbi:antitoxin Xre-like helix-turn-helix domain-containing protein [Allorhizobium pseudoryzae]|uniref:antitoxin Xre-like helix-turn-helix domain-containing protein n=1 Tax=Allorhizobium pseudoryzae TaxID=379684 RepID=UPI003D08F142
MPAIPNASTRQDAIERRGFADEGERARLSQTALKAYGRLVAAWGLTAQQAAALLGVSVSTWERMKAGPAGKTLSQDQMTRISALTGIYKGLHLLFVDDMADRWPQLSNSGVLFDRRTPVEAMMSGGIPHMLEVRRYVDAVRGGL